MLFPELGLFMDRNSQNVLCFEMFDGSWWQSDGMKGRTCPTAGVTACRAAKQRTLKAGKLVPGEKHNKYDRNEVDVSGCCWQEQQESQF